ncbi:aminoglycoside phosphotransferase family protein [Streptomyces sp. NPDC057445]|uniref:aminoglycoside phosphotransferase family protein n=1 Tax=Streptomyces sp. NPDC057445 TaxID=3346136 RepID=UPI0036D01A07
MTRLPLGERLRGELGTPRRVRAIGSSPRSHVWHVELDGTPAVVKQLAAGDGDKDGADERYAREVAALRLASRVDPPVVPRLLGADPVARVLVLEHVEHRRPAEGWVVAYAEALARLHGAATLGARPAAAGLPAWGGPGEGDVEAFLRLARTLGAAVAPGVEEELGRLVQRLREDTGCPPALLHGDPCPGNDLHTPEGIRFVDFEQASLGNGLTELAYVRIGFPTCWCVTAVREPELARAEAAYRRAWRAATGTDVTGDLTDACAGWLIRGDALVQRAQRGSTDQLARLARKDWRWGTVTARQRLLHRLGAVADMTREGGGRGTLTRTGRLCAELRERMPARRRLGPVPPPSVRDT